MRIVVVNDFYPPRMGGSALFSDNLARGFARAGHEVLVIAAAPAIKLQAVENAPS